LSAIPIHKPIIILGSKWWCFITPCTRMHVSCRKPVGCIERLRTRGIQALQRYINCNREIHLRKSTHPGIEQGKEVKGLTPRLSVRTWAGKQKRTKRT
jgi:hypothetical protein